MYGREAAPVIFSPRGAVREKVSKKFHSTENESIRPLPIFIDGTKICSILIHSAELYPILIHSAKLYPILIRWAELCHILLHYRTIPYLIHCQSLSLHCIKSKQYPQAWKLIAGVIISPNRNKYPREGPGKKSEFFFRKIAQCRKLSHSAENDPLHIFMHWDELQPIITECYCLPLYMHPLS